MRVYETTTIIHPDLTEDQVNEVISRLEAEIEKGNGKIIEVNLWGLRKLAYRIKRQQRGHYILFKYAAPPGLVLTLESLFRVMESVIRFMTVNIEQEIGEEDLANIKKILKKPEPAPEPEAEESLVEEEEFGEFDRPSETLSSSDEETEEKEIEEKAIPDADNKILEQKDGEEEEEEDEK